MSLESPEDYKEAFGECKAKDCSYGARGSPWDCCWVHFDKVVEQLRRTEDISKDLSRAVVTRTRTGGFENFSEALEEIGGDDE